MAVTRRKRSDGPLAEVVSDWCAPVSDASFEALLRELRQAGDAVSVTGGAGSDPADVPALEALFRARRALAACAVRIRDAAARTAVETVDRLITNLQLRCWARRHDAALLVGAGGQTFAVPVAQVVRVLEARDGDVDPAPAAAPLPHQWLQEWWSGEPAAGTQRSPCHALEVQVPAGRFVLVVDEVPGVFAFVLRPPGRLLQGHGAVAGMAVTDGGGTVPMLDLARIARPDPQ